MEIITEQKNNKNTRSFARFKNCYHTWLFTVDYSGIRVFFVVAVVVIYLWNDTDDNVSKMGLCTIRARLFANNVQSKRDHRTKTCAYFCNAHLFIVQLLELFIFNSNSPAVILVNLGQWILFAGDFECILQNFQDNFGWCMFKLKVLDRLIGIIGLILKFI